MVEILNEEYMVFGGLLIWVEAVWEDGVGEAVIKRDRGRFEGGTEVTLLNIQMLRQDVTSRRYIKIQM